MNRLETAALWLALGCVTVGMGRPRAAAQTPPANNSASSGARSAGLEKVIAQLNAASAKFKSAQADFTADLYQAVVQNHEVQSGAIYFERQKNETLAAIQIKRVDGKDAPKFVVYDGSALRFYQPAIKQMTIFRAGSNRGQYESFLTLGFGGSGADLEANWEVSFLGNETMKGLEVAKLDLKPKAQNVRNMFTHVTIWVDPARGISLKQIFYEPSGDQRTTTYENIKYNEPIGRDVFRIKTAPGTTVQTK